MEQNDDLALLSRARGGSAEAVSQLFERHAGKLLALIRLRMGPSLRARLESRDVLQATLLKAFQALESFKGAGATTLVAWMAQIAANEIRDQAEFHRRARRDAARDIALLEDHGAAATLRSALSELILSEEQLELERALEALPDQYREVIVLRRLEELSYAEIGERMKRSPDACRMLFARAMAALVAAIEESS
jgi:RNA polymerase sigma-70 factor (ECF subfamily)